MILTATSLCIKYIIYSTYYLLQLTGDLAVGVDNDVVDVMVHALAFKYFRLLLDTLSVALVLAFPINVRFELL